MSHYCSVCGEYPVSRSGEIGECCLPDYSDCEETHMLAGTGSYALSRLRQLCQETINAANAIMTNPGITDAEFREAFQSRDRAYVQSLGMDEDQLAECRWETLAGCNGSDSPFHSYFGYDTGDDY